MLININQANTGQAFYTYFPFQSDLLYGFPLDKMFLFPPDNQEALLHLHHHKHNRLNHGPNPELLFLLHSAHTLLLNQLPH